MLKEKHTNSIISNTFSNIIFFTLQTLKILNSPFQPFLKRHGWNPAVEFLLGKRDVRFTLFRIVGRQRTENDLRVGIGKADDLFGQLYHRKLIRITEVDWPRETILGRHHTGHAFHQIVHILETTGLMATAINRNIFVLKSLDNKIRDDTSYSGHMY